MRNAVTLCVTQSHLDAIRSNFKLLRDFGDAHAIVKVIDNGVDRHPRTEQHRLAAMHLSFDFHQRTPRPVYFHVSPLTPPPAHPPPAWSPARDLETPAAGSHISATHRSSP